jgi:pilus assembly protein Flp/PilA
MPKVLRPMAVDDAGQGLVEYAVIIALVSLGLVLSLRLLSGQISNFFNEVSNTLQAAS